MGVMRSMGLMVPVRLPNKARVTKHWLEEIRKDENSENEGTVKPEASHPS